MKAMILAAGFGKRLGELTKSKPKPLLEVKGKPLIDYHIEKLISSGFRTIAINTHYLGAQISDHVIHNFGQKVDIHISHEKKLLGTGGGIKKAISNFGDEDIVVINSDVYSDLDYTCFSNFSANTLFVVPSNQLTSGDFSVKEKLISLEGDKNYTWTGFSIIKKETFSKNLSSSFHYWHDCLKPLANNKKLNAEILDINWYDVGNVETLKKLNN
tara:strand:- start:631 stop:1272 length:642 start_codon:yes stop_codon:yes gene_type:complete